MQQQGRLAVVPHEHVNVPIVVEVCERDSTS